MNARIATTAAIAAAAVVLAGCSGGGDGDEGGETTLTVWDRSILRPEFGRDILAPAFEDAHPGVTVEFVEQPSDIAQADQAFRAAGIAGNGPDVTSLYAGGMVSSFAEFLEPLDEHFTDDEIAALSGWDTVRQDFRSDGALLGVPFGAGTYFEVFCNTDNLAVAGVEPPATPPATWDDFLAFLTEIKDGGQTPITMGNQEGYTGAWIMAALVGGDIGTDGFFDMFNGDLPIDGPEMVEAYRAYARLYSEGLTNPDVGALTNGDGESKFFNGEGACFISGDWQDGPLDENLGADTIVTFPIPVLSESSNVGAKAGGTAAALAVTNYSDNTELAVEFVKFATSAEMLDAYVETLQIEPSNHVDADISLIQNPLLRTQTEATAAAAAAGPEYLIFPFDSIMPQPVNDLFYRVNAAVLTGQTTPEDAVSQLQAEYDTWAATR